MFIQTESTPNPETLKFIPGMDVLPGSTAMYNSEAEAANSPLALALFDIADVKSVFLGSDFISVTKAENVIWSVVKPVVLTTIMEHFVAGRPVVSDPNASKPAHSGGAEDSEIVKQIKELLDTRVRPAVAEDGGDIVFRGFEGGVVMLELHGACAGCPSSTATLKQGIENMLQHYIPEVVSVQAV